MPVKLDKELIVKVRATTFILVQTLFLLPYYVKLLANLIGIATQFVKLKV